MATVPAAPPIDPAVDLQTFDEMPLNVLRLLNSDILSETTGDEFKAAVILWARSWHQVPAGSLPSDDRKLAYMAGYGQDTRGWKRVRLGALRGFELCSDGRLYHALIVELALSAWGRKRTGKDNALKRWNSKQRRSTKPQVTENIGDRSMPSHMADGSDGNADQYGKDDAKPMVDDVQRQCSEQSRADSKITPVVPRRRKAGALAPEMKIDFDLWYATFPLRKARPRAEHAYAAARKIPGATAEVLLDACRRYAVVREGEDPKFTKHPATWLNDQCWLDEPAQTANGHDAGAGLFAKDPREVEARKWRLWLQSWKDNGRWWNEAYQCDPPPSREFFQKCPPEVALEFGLQNPGG